MLPLTMFLSGVGFGFITGGVVVAWMLSKRRPVPPREPIDENRYPLNFRPRDLPEGWSRQ